MAAVDERAAFRIGMSAASRKESKARARLARPVREM
jgi:hypothetical protein